LIFSLLVTTGAGEQIPLLDNALILLGDRYIPDKERLATELAVDDRMRHVTLDP
jgi:hypothetical protein